MFIGTLKDAERCFPLHPGLKTLFDFVAANDFDALPLGRIEINGDKATLAANASPWKCTANI